MPTARFIAILALLLATACGDVGELYTEDPTADFLPYDDPMDEGSPADFLPLDDTIALGTPLPNAPKGLGDDYFPKSDGDWHSIQYMGKRSTPDLRGLGQHLQYWPMFSYMGGPATGRSTDHPANIELTPHFSDFEHRVWDKDRTFTGDDGGVKTAGGFNEWHGFLLPGTILGRSGTLYDRHACGNSSNTFNRLKLNRDYIKGFCLNLVTDNTNGRFDPNVHIKVKTDGTYKPDGENTPELAVPQRDLTFDGKPDIYTFKFTGMRDGDGIKINLRAQDGPMCEGAGLGGVMISDISTCCTPSCNSNNECGGDDGCGNPCPCTKGERQVNINPGGYYYLRHVRTRGVLSGTPWGVVAVTKRTNNRVQRWRFEGACQDARFGRPRSCIGQFRNMAQNACLRQDGGSIFGEMTHVGACDDSRAKWDFSVRGKDIVSGGRPFSGVERYTIRHNRSNNNYLNVARRHFPLTAKNLSNPNRPDEHWIVESAP